MADTLDRRCKACGGNTHEIHIIDKKGYAVDSKLEYSLPSAQPSFWTGKYAVAGKVLAYLCDGCGQIELYGQPETGK